MGDADTLEHGALRASLASVSIMTTFSNVEAMHTKHSEALRCSAEGLMTYWPPT